MNFSIFFIIPSAAQLTLLFLASLTDPGIVPRNAEAITTPPSSLGQIVNGVEVHRKWCYTCHIYRPPRGKHCGVCNCCIQKFDHHCTYLSNCIGERNYNYFIFFIFNSFIFSILIFIILLFNLNNYLNIIIFITSAISSLINLQITIYHGRLILSGKTMYEDSRSLPGDPYSLGNWRSNLHLFITRPIPPSLLISQPPSVKVEPTTVGNPGEIELGRE